MQSKDASRDWIFQSTLPREERRQRQRCAKRAGNFNPRSHERSDHQRRAVNFPRLDISIHAPTRGATTRMESSSISWAFQSTLPREERLGDLTELVESIKFQSTLPREERHIRQGKVPGKQRDFNPRSHERSDGAACNIGDKNQPFQSTLPREERQQYCTKNLFIFIQYRQ